MKKWCVIAASVLICILLTAAQEVAATEQTGRQSVGALGYPFTVSKLEGVEKKVEDKEETASNQMEHQREALRVTSGEEFSVTLRSNPTTGYHWQLAAPLEEKVVKLVGSVYRGPETKLIGAGGQEVWTFEAVGRGETVIEMKYVRPWEKDIPPVQTAELKVSVE